MKSKPSKHSQIQVRGRFLEADNKDDVVHRSYQYHVHIEDEDSRNCQDYDRTLNIKNLPRQEHISAQDAPPGSNDDLADEVPPDSVDTEIEHEPAIPVVLDENAGEDRDEEWPEPVSIPYDAPTNEDIATAEQTAAAEGDAMPESLALADKPAQAAEAPSQTKTFIDAPYIIDDEADIPPMLDEDGGGDQGTLPLQKKYAYKAQSKAGPIKFGLISVLLLAGMGAGSYYYFGSSDTAIVKKESAASDRRTDASKTERAPADTPGQRTTEITDRPSPEAAPSKGYRADIKPDKKGITILLHAPQGEAQLRDDTLDEAKRPDKEKSAATKARIEVIHVVAKGDTLWDIAEYYVNDPRRYPELARLSKINNPDLIYPGNQVRIIDTNGER